MQRPWKRGSSPAAASARLQPRPNSSRSTSSHSSVSLLRSWGGKFASAIASISPLNLKNAGLGLLQLLEGLEALGHGPAELGHWTTLLARKHLLAIPTRKRKACVRTWSPVQVALRASLQQWMGETLAGAARGNCVCSDYVSAGVLAGSLFGILDRCPRCAFIFCQREAKNCCNMLI